MPSDITVDITVRKAELGDIYAITGIGTEYWAISLDYKEELGREDSPVLVAEAHSGSRGHCRLCNHENPFLE